MFLDSSAVESRRERDGRLKGLEHFKAFIRFSKGTFIPKSRNCLSSALFLRFVSTMPQSIYNMIQDATPYLRDDFQRPRAVSMKTRHGHSTHSRLMSSPS
jgi:hypothetical protein